MKRAGALVTTLTALAALAIVPSASPEQASSMLRRLPAGFLDSGGLHTCVVLAAGQVRCWGFGSEGRLGYGNVNDIGDNETPGSVGPVDLGAGGRAAAITAGTEHTCALLDNGRVRCWGPGGGGRLGYGNTNSIGDNETPGSVAPVDLGTGRRAVAISAGGSHTCALLDNGRVRCWGDGGFGRLGYGNTNSIGDDETPGSIDPVDLGAGRRAVAISAGGYHTCALLDNGRVRCWGYGGLGALGYGNTNSIGDDEAPGSVAPVDLGAGRRAVAISAGASHGCALLDNGSVRCWGYGGFGALGYGNTNSIGDDETPGGFGPVDLGGRRALAISAGTDHSCALLDNGRVRCWGLGSAGRLGYGNTNSIGDNETPGSVAPVNAGALVVAKARPTLSFALQPKRDRRAPYTLRARGRLSGFLPDRATCAGLMQVRATTAGAARVAWKKLKVGAGACTYAVSLAVPRRGNWRVTAAFPGNGSLKGRTAPAKKFRAG